MAKLKSGTRIYGNFLVDNNIISGGPIVVGSAVTTGVNLQNLQVTGGTYISTSTGIGTTNPTQLLHVQGNVRIAGAIFDIGNSSGTNGQVLQSTGTGISWTTPAAGGGGGSGKFDTSIDNTLYYTPTGTLDVVGIGTTTTQITTLPSTASRRYLIHSIHVTNISNGDAEVTAAFDIDSLKISTTISSGGAGTQNFTVGSASGITIGMGVTGTNIDFNTIVTDISGTNVIVSKPLTGTLSGNGFFTPISKIVSRLPVPVGSAVELLKQPFVLGPNDSIRVQSTGIAQTTGTIVSTTATGTSGTNSITVGSATNITSGQLVTGAGIPNNTYVGVSYNPGSTTVPLTRALTTNITSASVQFSEVFLPQDGALQATIVYQSSTDTTYTSSTSRGAGIGTTAISYFGSGTQFPAVIQSIRVANTSDFGDYPVWVGVGNSDTIFNYLAYNLIIPKNSSIEICEAPKYLGIGQSIFAFSDTSGVIEVQVAGKQKTT